MQWQCREIEFDGVMPEPGAVLPVEFTGPNRERLLLHGFSDGEGHWRVRFAPTACGEWSFAIEQASRAIPLRPSAGRFLVDPPAGPTPLHRHGGFLKVATGGRHLTYTDGTPFFWLGDTSWYSVSDLLPWATSNRAGIDSAFRHLIDVRKAQGYSTMHMGFLAPDPRTGASRRPRDYRDAYLGQIDEAYWRGVDACIGYAAESGIVPVIGFGHALELTDRPEVELHRLWRYVTSRYGALPVTWLVCVEYNIASDKDPSGRTVVGKRDRERMERLFRVAHGIKEGDPYRRAMTIHPWWYGGDGRQAWGQPWNDFIMLQGGHYAEGPSPSYYRAIADTAGSIPFVEGECTFEGIYGYSDRVVRRNAYKAIQCGACGYTYGSHGLWYPNQDETDRTHHDWGEPVPWWEALQRPGGMQMKHLRDCYESVPWWTLRPVPGRNVLECDDSAADLDEFVLASSSREARDVHVLYLLPLAETGVPTRPAFRFTGGQQGMQYAAELFDPRTGRRRRMPKPFVGGGKNSLDTPAGAHDWVWIISPE